MFNQSNQQVGGNQVNVNTDSKASDDEFKRRFLEELNKVSIKVETGAYDGGSWSIVKIYYDGELIKTIR